MEIDGGGSQGREISTYSGAQSLKLLITVITIYRIKLMRSTQASVY
jgi:hypothetical protein